MPIARTKSLSIFGVLGAAGLLLAGCSSAEGTTAAEEQTVEEGCTILVDGVTEMEDTLMGSAEELQADPEAMEAAFQDVLTLFQGNIDKVTNEEVVPVAEKLGDVFGQIGDARDAAAADPNNVDQAAMTTLTNDLQDVTTELSEVCGVS